MMSLSKFKLKQVVLLLFYAAVLVAIFYLKDHRFPQYRVHLRAMESNISMHANHSVATPTANSTIQQRIRMPRIYCIVLTKESNVASGKAKSIYDAWAHKCDNCAFIAKHPLPQQQQDEDNSTQTSSTVSSTITEWNHALNILDPPGLVSDTYDKLTDKVLLAIRYLHNNFSRDSIHYDWYLKADDDTFVLVDNLRLFLAQKNASEPITYGYDFKALVESGYHSGGAGYVLSNEAFARLNKALNSNESFCQNTGTEDVDVARCLRKL
jgi:glycoprotein-N-acetylgalactosamine 3-beta-galactosyltransferase